MLLTTANLNGKHFVWAVTRLGIAGLIFPLTPCVNTTVYGNDKVEVAI